MENITKTTQNAWRRFVATNEGKEGLLYLREKIPAVLGETSEKIILGAGVAQGWKQCLDAINSMLAAEERQASEDRDDRLYPTR